MSLEFQMIQGKCMSLECELQIYKQTVDEQQKFIDKLREENERLMETHAGDKIEILNLRKEVRGLYVVLTDLNQQNQEIKDWVNSHL